MYVQFSNNKEIILKLSLILIVKEMTALEHSCSSMHPREAQKKLPHHKR